MWLGGLASSLEVVGVGPAEGFGLALEPIGKAGCAEELGAGVHEFTTETRDLVTGNDDVAQEETESSSCQKRDEVGEGHDQSAERHGTGHLVDHLPIREGLWSHRVECHVGNTVRGVRADTGKIGDMDRSEPVVTAAEQTE